VPHRDQKGEFVRVAGEPLRFAVETSHLAKNIDHFWITIRAGSFGSLVIALSTYSRKNAEAGFDPRMRVGSLASSCNQLPADGVVACQGLTIN
jgi:hypothetical protein